MIRQLGALSLIGLLLACAGGCTKPKGTVSGKVTLRNGTPVEVGNIVFYAKDGRQASAPLGKGGSYTMGDAPVGAVKVVIQPPPAKAGPGGMSKPPAGQGGMPKEFEPENAQTIDPTKIVPIASRYQNKDDTPLEYTVEKGEHDDGDFTLDP